MALVTVKKFLVLNMGFVAAARWVGAVIGNLLGGIVSDRLLARRRKLGMMLSALATAGMMFALINSPADPVGYKTGPGQINVPVSIDGQVIHPADLIIGDEDGIVSFSQSQAATVIEAAKRTAAMEEGIKAEIANGKVEQAWLDRVLTPFGL